MHIKIPVCAQSPPEPHILLAVCQRPVALVDLGIAIIVDRIIRLISRLPLLGVLPCDHRFRLRAEFKMLMLNNPSIRRLGIGIIDHRIALIILHIQCLLFKPETPIF